MGDGPALCDCEQYERPGTVYPRNLPPCDPAHPPSQVVGSVYLAHAAIATSCRLRTGPLVGSSASVQISLLPSGCCIMMSLSLALSHPASHTASQSRSRLAPLAMTCPSMELNDGRATPCHAMPSMGAWTFAARRHGLHHRRAPFHPTFPFRPYRCPSGSSPSSPSSNRRHSTANLGSAVEPFGNKPGAEHIIGPPVYLICSPHKSLVLSTQQCSSQLHPALPRCLGTVEPRDLTASSRCSPEKHWSTLCLCDSRQLCLSASTPEHAVVAQLSLLWPEPKLCSANESKCLRDLHR